MTQPIVKHKYSGGQQDLMKRMALDLIKKDGELRSSHMPEVIAALNQHFGNEMVSSAG